MNEQEFLKTLEKRVQEQEKIIKNLFLPGIFAGVSYWLGEHPWRILIPLAFILTLIFYAAFGKSYIDFILKVFGKL